MAATLTDLANACGTDKGTVAKQGHGYSLVYEPLFAPYRDRPVDILEVGLSIGGPEMGFDASRAVSTAPSLDLWLRYFKEPRVVGFDISDFKKFEDPRFSFVQGDCGKAEELDRVAKLGRMFDIIVDDGSHASYHQHLTFLKLFPLLKPGGIYIIEDMTWQPREYEAQLPKTPKMRVHLDRFLRNGAFDSVPTLPTGAYEALAPQIGSVMLYDTFTLWAYGDAYNRREHLKRERAGYPEKSKAGRFAAKAFRRSLLSRFAQTLDVLAYDAREIKLAIIHKECPPAGRPLGLTEGRVQ